MGKAFIQSERQLIEGKGKSSALHSKSPDRKVRRCKMTVIRKFETSRFSEEVLAEAYERLLPTSYLVACAAQGHHTDSEGCSSSDADKQISI
tara:strand:+ start:144 stop:419 length:276 start_codon:yes stop_codon:yes gene_type:complete